MRFVQYYLDCLSHASYLVGDETTGKAVVVDPRRDVYECIADAGRHGLTIIGVINTHVHSDFVAGHLEMAHATGAWIGYGRRAEADYPIRQLTDGDRIVLGDVVLHVMETPGHTPESISLVVYEHAADPTPYGVLTGDTLAVDVVARPDLVASVDATADELARMLYHSIGRLMALPDATRVFPTHGGSSTSARINSSTIGEQSTITGPALFLGEDGFGALVAARRSVAPLYYTHDAMLNRGVHDLLYAPTAPLEIDDVLKRQAQGAIVVDARDPESFAAGHLRGSINVPADGRFAETAGTVVEPDDEVVLVAPQDRESELRIRLGRVGFEHIAGYLRDPRSAVVAVPEQVVRARRVTASQLATALAGPRPPVVVDVRTADEVADGAIFRARHIPLAELPRRLADIPPRRPVVVYCAGGYRSCVAASLLRRNGWEDVTDLVGGYTAWTKGAATPTRDYRPVGP